MEFIDVHAHYFDSRFEEEYPGGAAAAIAASREAGCVGAINAGTNEETSAAALSLAESNPGFFAAVGIHPEDCEALTGSLDDEIDKIRALAAHQKAIAIGEIGLDYHWDIDRGVQMKYFTAQMELARELSLPVVIHDRDAHGDVFDVLRSFPDVRAVMHSYSGSAENARQLAANGRYISFSGVLTFKNARHAAETAQIVPPELILVETDCPYMAPVPHRGEINLSAYVPLVIRRLAEIRGVGEEETADQLLRNTRECFGI